MAVLAMSKITTLKGKIYFEEWPNFISKSPDIMKKFINTFGVKCIGTLLGDREFIGEQWFKWLNDNAITFCIRIKKDAQFL